ncbi:hypothetical protein EA456_01390 [Streptococcus dysgalactiae subsp. dysgalactiae]|nr:hypothetical protein WH81_00420 [Streptococcus dysgalactiae subsp. equisimilis]OCX07334.1 hypothetical protein GCS_08705 [Streptococcus dysgalactiae subsp. equisimilis AKSDE4288]QGG99268.1 hypothetical protein EA456_01390 [Streptococcus dysgalactiae subsp. dysgalactiae]BAN94372.1 hypothetical protein SDSE167_1997 [Streptococcus dysgalactiae subsp. equisimilis 167]KKC19495.1 hypothetical protein WH14_05170 [Streptococcus dysgalactiae subsp. equisimilis]
MQHLLKNKQQISSDDLKDSLRLEIEEAKLLSFKNEKSWVTNSFLVYQVVFLEFKISKGN